MYEFIFPASTSPQNIILFGTMRNHSTMSWFSLV
jgi:hypothetical protein